ncbi:MAG: YIP1 family protein [Bacteroidetes bacterium]|nr:YIP1 family protein [Bacteroidota bacterium]
MSDLEQTTGDIEEVNPWIDIWSRPRQTIDWIIENNSSLLTTVVLIYLGGVCFGIRQAEVKELGDKISVGTILTMTLFVSGFGGLLTYNIWIWAIDFCASWFGGKGNFRKTQTAFAWSMLPMVAGLILAIIGYVLFEEELFTSETPNIDGSDFLTISVWVYGILELALVVWQIVLLVATVSQVQRFSVAKSIASIVTGFLILIVPIVALVLLMT